ncbi:MAG: hypothetical protein LBR96_06290, partial [Treponema sp.]|nr:hypothetical protein [Treponema sp.]
KCTKYQNAVILATDSSFEQIKRAIKDCSNFKFVKTLDEFKENISPNSYLVISISITEFSAVEKIIKQYPDCFFNKIIEPPDAWPLNDNIQISKNRNVNERTYLTFELIEHIKKEVQLVR